MIEQENIKCSRNSISAKKVAYFAKPLSPLRFLSFLHAFTELNQLGAKCNIIHFDCFTLFENLFVSSAYIGYLAIYAFIGDMVKSLLVTLAPKMVSVYN